MALREAVSTMDRLRALGARKRQLVLELHQLAEQQTAVWQQFQIVQQQEDDLMQEVGHLLVSVTGGPGMHAPGIRSMQDIDLEPDPAWKKPRIDTVPNLGGKPDGMGSMPHRPSSDLTPRASAARMVPREPSPPQGPGYNFGRSNAGPAMWPSMHEPAQLPSDIQQRNAQMKEAQIRIAVQIKACMPDPLENAQGGKNLLRSAVLAGQPLEYRKQGQAVGLGMVAHNNAGTVICKCNDCKGRNEVSLSLFEAHSGSTLRRPAEFTFLSNFNISIKDLLTLVNSEEVVERYSKCQLCHSPGDDLLRCDKCGCAFHSDCLGFSSQGQEDPPCPACVQKASLLLNHSPLPYGSGMKPDGTQPTTSTGLHGLSLLPFSDDTPDPLIGGGMPSKDASRVRNKRLFLSGSGLLQEGEMVKYVVGDKVMMEGTVCLGDATQPGGIRCDCCKNIISCSAFEQHAGYGTRRAPYDHILTSKGVSLKRLAELGPDVAGKMPSALSATSLMTHTPKLPHAQPSLISSSPPSSHPHIIPQHMQSQHMTGPAMSPTHVQHHLGTAQHISPHPHAAQHISPQASAAQQPHHGSPNQQQLMNPPHSQAPQTVSHGQSKHMSTQQAQQHMNSVHAQQAQQHISPTARQHVSPTIPQQRQLMPPVSQELRRSDLMQGASDLASAGEDDADC